MHPPKPNPSGPGSSSVTTIMNRKVISVRPEAPLVELIRLLVDHHVSGLPVVDENCRPIGMVSQSDLISEDYEWAEIREGTMAWKAIAGRAVSNDAGLFDERNLASRTVGDLMTTNAIVVPLSVTIREAAEQMVAHRVHRLMVVDDQRRLAGIVTALDVTRWVARQM